METKFLQSQSRNILTKEAYLFAISVASTVTSDLIVHRSMLKSPRLRSKSHTKQNQTLKLPRLIMLLGISSNIPRDLFQPVINVARLVTTNPGASSQSPVSLKITISMRGHDAEYPKHIEQAGQGSQSCSQVQEDMGKEG